MKLVSLGPLLVIIARVVHDLDSGSAKERNVLRRLAIGKKLIA